MSKFDQLYRYLFDKTAVRGELVQLDASFARILQSQQYPAAIQKLLGELMAATSLLTATLKFEGEITVQVQGEGALKFAAINGDNQQRLRGVARWEGDIADDATLAQMAGKGTIIITITPEQGERYQGVVALEGDSLAHSLENYFAQSEQLNTKIWLFTGHIEGVPKAAGILLQQLPNDNEYTETDFDHLAQLTHTITEQEILSLDSNTLLYRLYHEEQVRLFDPQSVSFFCGCSKERCSSALQTVESAELETLLKEQGKIVMHCDYCGIDYQFDEQDIAQLFPDKANNTLH